MSHIYEAKGFWARCYGWHCFGHSYPQEGLFLPRCQLIHSLGLKRPLWVLFVNAQGQVLGKWRYLKPNRIMWHKGAYGVIEKSCMSHKKRRQMQAALINTDWLAQTTHWEVGYFGQKYYEK